MHRLLGDQLKLGWWGSGDGGAGRGGEGVHLSVLREEQKKKGALPMLPSSQTGSQAQSFNDKHRVTVNMIEQHDTVNE